MQVVSGAGGAMPWRIEGTSIVYPLSSHAAREAFLSSPSGVQSVLTKMFVLSCECQRGSGVKPTP